MLVQVFANKDKPQEGFHFYEMVIAFLLYIILDDGRFHRNVLLSGIGGGLCL